MEAGIEDNVRNRHVIPVHWYLFIVDTCSLGKDQSNVSCNLWLPKNQGFDIKPEVQIFSRRVEESIVLEEAEIMECLLK